MRRVTTLLSNTILAVVYAAAIAVAVGVAGSLYTQRIEGSVRAAAIAFVVAAIVVGFGLWRTNRPGSPGFLGRRYTNR